VLHRAGPGTIRVSVPFQDVFRIVSLPPPVVPDRGHAGWSQMSLTGGYLMRSYDFTPLYRATVGFDRVADLLGRVLEAEPAATNGYPPYNIEKTADDAYRISVAVAGFTEADLNIEARATTLVVSASRVQDDKNRTYLHRGIATRAFEKTFQLADHVHVTGAQHENGMLHIDLVRKVPDALKPRRIHIARAAASPALEGTTAKTVEV
jgi:molecular chaperone IbpA